MLDPQCASFLAPGADAPELIDLPISVGRNGSYAGLALAGEIESDVLIRTQFIPGETADLAIRIYTPRTSGPHPGMLYIHGGGWAYFSIDFYDAQLSALSKLTDSVIVSVNYQKSPEHKFPIPHDDSYSALKWVFENSHVLSIDKDRIGVGGDSAGGNLAAGVALRARDEKDYPLAYQLLIYPALGVDFDTNSYVNNGTGYGLTKRTMSWLWSLYLDRPEDWKNPYAVPLASEDLQGLPPAIVITAEYDVLRDDGAAYANVLRKSGVPVIYKDFEGMIHGFFNYGTQIEEGMRLRNWIKSAILDLLAK
jgi:acetyl esterase